jgi:antitoxin component YwqK of YwqJK toxin-antitoxin module
MIFILEDYFFRIARAILIFTISIMRSNILSFLLITFYFYGCSTEDKESNTQSVEVLIGEKEKRTDLVIDDRFVSKDREIEKIFSDFEKPVRSFPTIEQTETETMKNGRLYRKDLWEEPFTGTVVEHFSDGSLSLETSYYRGLPHGQQIRNFSSGQRALEANFDQGVLVGVKSRWWPHGQVREKAYWSEGKYIGRRLWDRTGRLIKEEIVPQS